MKPGYSCVELPINLLRRQSRFGVDFGQRRPRRLGCSLGPNGIPCADYWRPHKNCCSDQIRYLLETQPFDRHPHWMRPDSILQPCYSRNRPHTNGLMRPPKRQSVDTIDDWQSLAHVLQQLLHRNWRLDPNVVPVHCGNRSHKPTLKELQRHPWVHTTDWTQTPHRFLLQQPEAK